MQGEYHSAQRALLQYHLYTTCIPLVYHLYTTCIPLRRVRQEAKQVDDDRCATSPWPLPTSPTPSPIPHSGPPPLFAGGQCADTPHQSFHPSAPPHCRRAHADHSPLRLSAGGCRGPARRVLKHLAVCAERSRVDPEHMGAARRRVSADATGETSVPRMMRQVSLACCVKSVTTAARAGSSLCQS